ncbi:MAG: glycosyltransferase family 4 protein [Blastocatellia bacterium]
MKILFPYLARWRSANRSRYHQLLTHLCEFGHQVYVLTAPPMALNDISANDLITGDEVLPPGLTISELKAPQALRSFWRIPVRRSKLLKKGLVSITSLNQIRRFVDKEQIDVLLLYNLPQAPLLHLVDCHAHFDLADDLVAMMEVELGIIAKAGMMTAANIVQNYMLKKAATVTVASSVLEEQIERRVLMLPNGADIGELDQVDDSAWRSQKTGPTVGFVGAFEYWVDFELVLRTAKRLPHVTFLLVGSGRRLTDINQMIAEFGLKNVVLTGAKPYREAMSYVAGMDVCLLPFTEDAVADGSCPLKLFEYAALRKPIVSTPTREVSRIGQGWISFADDDAGFADAIQSLLADRRAVTHAGEAGRALVEQLYNWPNLTRQLEELLLKGAVPSFEPATARRLVLETLESGLEPQP